MARRNRWISVCHSIAHHGASGLCNVHPNLGLALQEAGGTMALVDLLADAAAPGWIAGRGQLRKALGALRARFADIIEAEALARADLAEARLLFVFAPGSDATCSTVHACLKAKDGHRILRAVDYLGAQLAPRSDF